MVTLITEKLRNQSLSDLSADYAQIPAWSPPSPPQSAFHITEKWSLYVDKNSSANKATDVVAETSSQKLPHPSPQPAMPATGEYHTHSPSGRKGHRQNVTMCTPVSSSPSNSNPPPPPKKRHCRSLSIPGDGTNSHKLQQQQQGSSSVLLRPVAVRPHLNNNKLMKNRNSPLGLHHHRSCTSPLHKNLCSSPLQKAPAANTAIAMATACFSPQQHGGSTPGSGVWSAIGSDYFATPPESPVPRPASVSSGYCDNTLGPYLNAPWLMDQAQVPLQTAATSSSGNFLRHSWDCGSSGSVVCVGASHGFVNRSLSLEEHISDSGRSSSHSAGESSGASCVRSVSTCTQSAGSMPAMPGSTRSTPPSPQRVHRPRCRSQPSTLLDRRCGIKRRRDEERPSLNFSKMTETAYSRFNKTDNGITIPHPKCGKSSRSLASMFSEKYHNFAGLMTIASSPMDTNMPLNGSLVRTPCESPDLNPGDVASAAVNHDLTDSGCSDVNDTGDDNCLCNDDDDDDNNVANDEKDDDHDEFTHEVFNDLDLDQIEKD